MIKTIITVAIIMSSFSYADNIRINQIQLKGTHNSYHVLKPYNPVEWLPWDLHITDWNYTHAPITEQLTNQGVRQVELDIHMGKDGFPVYHLTGIDNGSTCKDLTACLIEVRDWSIANPHHQLLWLLIEPKDTDDPGNYFGEWIADHLDTIEENIESLLGSDNIYKPSELRGSHPTMRDRIEKEGWPTLDATRGKITIVWNAIGSNKKAYANYKPEASQLLMLLKATPEELIGDSPSPYDMVYTEVGDPLKGKSLITELVEKGFMVRTRAEERGLDSNEAKKGKRDRPEAALESGAQIISTDIPAKVPETDYFFAIPGDHVSRCNPVNSDAECKPELIEP